MKTMQIVTTAAILLTAGMAFSEADPVVVAENQTVIQVNGVVCSFCAYGAEKALSKLDGLNTAEFGNGVLVDVEAHRITLALQPSAKIPFQEIYSRIKNAGYDPITVYVRPEGKLEKSEQGLQLRDARSGQVFAVLDSTMPGIADQAEVAVQAHFEASLIPELGESEPVVLTIDRLISTPSKAGEMGEMVKDAKNG